MVDVEQDVTERLAQAGITPLIKIGTRAGHGRPAGICPQLPAPPGCRGSLTASPFVRRGNRRFYKIADIVRFFATDTD